MELIPKTMLFTFFSFFGVLLIIGLLSVEIDYEKAKNYKADVITEIENSNFSDKVIDACVENAENNGYELTVNPTTVNAHTNEQYAEVILKYNYNIPILNIQKTKELRGFAR